jgi:hypothetical protein
MTQIFYESTINVNRRLCSRYFVDDMMWLSIKNIQTARLTVKLNDRNIDLYRVSKIFFNSLIIQLKLLDTMKIHLVFHVNLLQHDVNDSFLEQISKSRELVIAEDE